MQIKICKNKICQQEYRIFSEDLAQLKLYGIDAIPEYCPLCRHRQRALFIPGYSLHSRLSSKSNQKIYSIYSEQAAFPVYTAEEWWSDDWNPKDYGRDFDFNVGFFPQYQALFNAVPKMANNLIKCENSQFAIYAANSKSIYMSAMIFRNSEDIYYTISATDCSNICDCLRCFSSSYLYECVQCTDIHYSAWLLDCHNTRESYYSYDLRNCSDCLFCYNLRNKKYYYKNKDVGKEEFQKLKARHLNGSNLIHQQNIAEWYQLIANAFSCDQSQGNSENCYGHGLQNCSNAFECYHSINLENCRYCEHIGAFKTCSNSMDITQGGIGDMIYNSSACGAYNNFLRMCTNCRTSSNLTYCAFCYDCKDCFGCVNLRNAQYCIFNKQYSADEYKILSNKIIKHMKAGGEWGQFFPAALSPFAYNNSMAMQFYPLSRQEAELSGFRWEETPQRKNTANFVLPDNLADLNPESTASGILCEFTQKNFRIISKEYDLLKILNLSAPRQHPSFRLAQRFALLGPSELKSGHCCQCKQEINYHPCDYISKYLCSNCYLQVLD